MQKKILLAVGLLIVAGIGLFAFTQFSSKSSQNKGQQDVAESMSDSDDSVITGSIRSLLGMNKNVKCTYTDPNEKTKSDGTIYVSGQKMRGDFAVTDETGKQYESFMIQDGEYAYIWSNESADGTKMKVSEMEKLNQMSEAESANKSVDVDSDLNMHCSGWTVDASMFLAPDNIRFVDMTDFMMQMDSKKTSAPSSSGDSQIDSSVCDQIVDPQAKAACISAASGQ